MKNRLTNLNDHLFEALERLNDDDMSSEVLKDEVQRARTVAAVSREIINNARLVLDAEQYVNGGSLPKDQKLPLIFADKPILEAVNSDSTK